MKKILLSVVLIAISFVDLSAQKLVTGGVKVGVNHSGYLGDDSDGHDYKQSVHLGFFIEIPMTENISVSPELMYSEQGSEFSDSNSGLEGDFRFTYFNIPVMFKYYVGEKLNLQLGPQLGFLVKSDFVSKSNGVSLTEDAEVLLDTPTADFGVNAGLGYYITEKLFVDARYNFGLADVSEILALNNSVFQLSIGYRLD